MLQMQLLVALKSLWNAKVLNQGTVVAFVCRQCYGSTGSTKVNKEVTVY